MLPNEGIFMIKRFVGDLKREFSGYNGQGLVKDLLAGVTVTAVALPLALAFGVSSGADAASGLITAIIAGLVISLLSGGYYQISGPTGAMAAILMSLVANYSMQGVFLATLLAGILLILAGIFRLGRLTSFIPMPVITGFTSGIAVIIALGQVDNFFGVTSEGANAIEKLLSYGTLGFSPDWAALAIGLFVILFMVFFPKKWNAVVPASLISIIIATAASILLKLDVATVGAIPKTLMPEVRLQLGSIDFAELKNFIAPAISIAALGMIESLLCGASAGRMTGVPLNNDQELLAQGIGNVLLPFFGGIPATAAIARTSVAIKSGAKTRLTGIFHAVGLLLSMFLLGSVMSKIPLSALAGVLMVTAWRMNEWHTIKYIFSHKFKGAMLKFLATMIATIVFDLTVAILIGVVIALVLMAMRISRVEINYEPVDASRLPNADEESLKKRFGEASVVYISGPLMFASCQAIEEIPHNLPACQTLFLSMRGVSNMDISGAQSLMKTLETLKKQGTEIHVCALTKTALKMMQRSGIEELIGKDHFHWSVAQALLSETNQ